MMLFLIVLLPLSILLPHKKGRSLPPYMGGVETTHDMHFQNALGARTEMKLANYYVGPWFGEARLATTGVCLCSVLIVLMFAAAVTGGGAFL